MLLDIEHKLRFAYEGFVSESWMELRVEPRTLSTQSLETFYLAVGPATKVFRYADWNGNVVHHFGIPDFHEEIEVVSRSLVETRAPLVIPIQAQDAVDGVGELGPLRDFIAFGGPVVNSASLASLAASVPAGGTLGERFLAIGERVADALTYRTGATDYRSTSDDALAAGSGVCQDFAHVMLGLLRREEIACRYVSGYLHVEGRESESHAWVEAWSPTVGWIGYDPTHRIWPDERYVVVAYGRHYDDVPPNRGIYRGIARESLHARVKTEVSGRGARSGLREEMGQIDLPVYAELPMRPSRADALDDQGPSQQQQQQ